MLAIHRGAVMRPFRNRIAEIRKAGVMPGNSSGYEMEGELCFSPGSAQSLRG